MPDRPLRLAIAQARSIAGDVGGNVAASVRTVIAAGERGARLVVFPELSLTGYDLELLAATPAAWLTVDDARLAPLRGACADAGVTAVVGAPVRTSEGRRHIAAIVVTPAGALRPSYKVHVHDSEIAMFEPGPAAPPFDVGGWKVAIAVCFDAARPRHAEAAAALGADLYLVSALYVIGEERRLDLHLGARAMDQRMFAALANHAGTTGGHVSCGASGVWGPTGAALTRATADDEALVVVDLDPAELARFR